MKRDFLTPAAHAVLLASMILSGCGVAAKDKDARTAGPANSGQLEQQFLAKIDELAPGIGAPKIEDRKDAQVAFERICLDNSAPAKSAERAALCKAILKRVDPSMAKPARVWLLRKVESIGRDEVVDGLTALLADPDSEIRELARRALANNHSPKAGAALRAELAKATDSAWRVAIINAFAFREDKQAVSQLSKLAGDKDPAVASAAISALGAIADDSSLEALASLRKKAPAEHREEAVNASLRAAQKLVAADNKRKAAAICDEIYHAAAAENVRIAALQGIAAAKGADAIPMLLGLINGTDGRLQLVAARCAQAIPGEKATQSLADALKKASPDAKAVLLEMLGKRGDAKAAAAVASYMDAPEADVRVAAIGALRYIGNGSHVGPLAKFAAKAKDAERDAARESLQWMKGKDVDDAVLKLAATADGRVKAELVRAAAVRAMRPAFDLLLAATTDADESVRLPVINSIGKLGKPADLPRVIASFGKLQGDGTVEAAKNALVQIASKVADESQRPAALVAGLASADPACQVIILRALANLKSPAALDALRKCAASDNPQVKQAAVQALADWGPAYCTQWVCAGPFSKGNAAVNELFDAAFPPEEAQAAVEWKPVKESKGRDLDLQAVFKKTEGPCCGYVRTKVISHKGQDVLLAVGSDDGVKVWLNGAVVHANNATRAFQLDQDQVKITLKQGENVLLVKVTQGGGQWQVSCGFKSPQGGPADGVKFEAK